MRRSFKILVALFALVIAIGTSLALATNRGVHLFNSPRTTGSIIRGAPAKLVPVGPTQGPSTNSITVSGSGHFKADGTGKQYVGAAELMIDGESRHATVTVTLAEPFRPMPNGNQVASASHRFDLGDGQTLNMSGQLILMPGEAPEMLRINSGLGITVGTGTYANARGNLALTGVMQGDLSAADWSINGSIEN